MDETDMKQLKFCIENNVPNDSKGRVVYWKEGKTDCFEFKKVKGNIAKELSGVYIFEYDLYTKVKIPYDDIEHIILTEMKSQYEVEDKYNLRDLYDE
ncbi:MAG: hypothetical protein JEZ08_01675 [Clostridiales bacterium]|nr:hypothetical protein [Clostridiales bacterium]